MKFIAIVGTNASFSYNRKLLWYMKKHFKNQAQIDVVEITDVPLFSEDTKVFHHLGIPAEPLFRSMMGPCNHCCFEILS